MAASETFEPTIAVEIPRIRALLRQQRFSEALTACQSWLAGGTAPREVQIFAAISQRGLGRVGEALQTLDSLERQQPRFSRLHEERGNCFVALKDAPRAIEAFLLAVNLNNALPASWRMLEGLYRMTGDAPHAATAASHVATLARLPPEVVTATGFFMDGDLEIAEPMVRSYLLSHGDHIEAMRLLARIGIARKVFDDAAVLLAAVLELAPDYGPARREYAGVLIDLHRYQEARAQLELLLRDAPDDRGYRTMQATAAVGLGDHELAMDIYRELLLQPSSEDADLHLSLAHAQKTLGQRQAAVDSYRRAAASRPAFGDAYWSLANLKTYRFTDEELARLRDAQSNPGIATIDRYHLCFALGKALEDRGEFAESFRYYELGNALKRTESNYRPEIIETNTRQQIEICTAAFFAERRAWGVADPAPIFIVGLPRSGSTLIEQILASHSLVEGTQELANVQQIVAQLRGRDLDDPRYPRVLPHLAAGDFQQMGRHYLDGTEVYRTGKPLGKAFFIDKMPNNFRHLGLIHLMLPQARIIDARREPMACCFSNFKQLFANGQEFTYSIEDIARYYRSYLELMRHWNRVLPGRVLRVRHEDVVDDLERNVRRILDFCGLEFESACLDFHKTVRSVRTASSEQVRQPIYREGLEQWKNFEAWLGPLQRELGDALVGYADE
jgi:tetratricopeptide (TPR) repeat protein